jgi:hypothetical protein
LKLFLFFGTNFSFTFLAILEDSETSIKVEAHLMDGGFIGYHMKLILIENHSEMILHDESDLLAERRQG